MKKLLRFLAVAVLGLSLTTGVVSAMPGSGSIENTGPNSDNRIEVDYEREVDVDNDNRVRVRNDNPQRATSGDARVSGNTTGGDAETGDATNDSLFRANLRVDNTSATSHALGGGWGGGSWDGSIDTTGPNSDNRIEVDYEVDVDVDNDNRVEVRNNNTQTATTGDARVSGNTTGGDATTGDATNVHTTEVTVDIRN